MVIDELSLWVDIGMIKLHSVVTEQTWICGFLEKDPFRDEL